MNEQTYFRLFGLPGELVEYVSFFFNTAEAHKLLTVSRAFHDLFARRVWWKLDSRVFTLSEPTRSTAIARYGKLVRSIDIDDKVCSAIKPDIDNGASVYNTLSVFSGVTALRIDYSHNHLTSVGIQFRDIIMCFPSLYRLSIKIVSDKEPYDLVTLAHAINHRQNSNMNPIEYLNLLYSVRNTDDPWARLANFVQMVSCKCGMKIAITPWTGTRIHPSQSELQVLSKYFVISPDIDKREDTQFCCASLNRSLFWRPLADFYSRSYPQLRQLYVQTCCASTLTYDYSDITPSNFPSLQVIRINGHECSNMITHSYPPAWEKVLLQRWPHLNQLTLHINITCQQLLTILEYHRRLTTLSIWLQPKMLNKRRIFNVATILPLLPKLQGLFIHGNDNSKIDYSPDYDDSDMLAQSQLNTIWLFSLYHSSRVFKLIFSLPKLNKITINHCRFYSTGVTEIANMDDSTDDPSEIDINSDDDSDDDDDGVDDNLHEELMATLNAVSAKYSLINPCGITFFGLQIKRGYNWPLGVTLEMIALMPKLRTLNLRSEVGEILIAIKERFPHIKVKYYR
ncbi:hypothetical protein GQ42DRAFT_165789 [Ramicandelaber brevisporus]|nr:hypothetical protein GQ42DRAFT_165789 [Ramicandelaber brevisporus]